VQDSRPTAAGTAALAGSIPEPGTRRVHMYETPQVVRIGSFRELTLGGKKDFGHDLAHDVDDMCEYNAGHGSPVNHALCIS
jgi:hypothetical protein